MLLVYIHSNWKRKWTWWGECFNVKDGEEGTARRKMIRGGNKRGGERRNGVMDKLLNKWPKGMLAQYLWISLIWPHFGTCTVLVSQRKQFLSLPIAFVHISYHCSSPCYFLPLKQQTSSLAMFLSFLHPPNNAITLPTVYHLLFPFFYVHPIIIPLPFPSSYWH